MTERHLVSIERAGERLGVARGTIYQLIANGHLRRVKIGRRALVTSESLETYLNEIH